MGKYILRFIRRRGRVTAAASEEPVGQQREHENGNHDGSRNSHNAHNLSCVLPGRFVIQEAAERVTEPVDGRADLEGDCRI